MSSGSMKTTRPPMSNPQDLLPNMPVRCECRGPVAIISNPPGGVSYGWCLACGCGVSVRADAQSTRLSAAGSQSSKGQ